LRRLDPVLLSAVVPCFDEELVIRETHARLVATLERLVDTRFEILYVDDGSRDGSLAVLRTIQQSDARVRVISLSRNFGQQIAVAAGLEHAAGDAVVLIDADLQDPPEVIPEMVERWRAGVDVAGFRTGTFPARHATATF
jgi:dolichol-phosphate mannosyltransferase